MRAHLIVAAATMIVACGPERDDVPRRQQNVSATTRRAPPGTVAAIDAELKAVDGPVGVSVVSLDGGWRYDHGCSRRLPQQSVSKTWVAMTVMSRIDEGSISLSTQVVVLPGDLTLFHQPIVRMVGAYGYRTNVTDLLVRSMTQSDNTANDRLLSLVGGPDAVRRFMRSHDVMDVDFGPGERLLQSGTAGMAWQQRYSTPWAFQRAREGIDRRVRLDAYRRYVGNPPDGATACGIADALTSFEEGRLLSPTSTAVLKSIMGLSRTGFARLRAGLRPGWSLIHKTGTGQEYAGRTAGFNDVGVVRAPDGSRYVIAIMIGDSTSSERTRQRMISGVMGAVVDRHGMTTARGW